jgi:hypothetical protein
MNTVKHAELITLDRYTNLKLLRNLVEKDLSTVRSKSIQNFVGSFIQMYAKIQNKTQIYQSHTIGLILLDQKTLLNLEYIDSRLTLHSSGILILDPGISPELIRDTIESIHMFGLLICSKKQRSALAEKIRFGLFTSKPGSQDTYQIVRENRDEFLRNFPGWHF